MNYAFLSRLIDRQVTFEADERSISGIVVGLFMDGGTPCCVTMDRAGMLYYMSLDKVTVTDAKGYMAALYRPATSKSDAMRMRAYDKIPPKKPVNNVLLGDE